jgi:flavin-dependent dehydrogenase
LFHRANVISLLRREDGWRVGLDDGRELRARWLIDATGRRARLARLTGLRRQRGAPLVALYRTGQPETNRDLNRTLITAGPDGWIYAGRRGDDRWVFGYHTTPQQAALLHRHVECWNDIIAASAGLTDLLGPLSLDPLVHAHDARSAWLDPPIGEGWIACGDAALAFDPIAGQGLFNALYTAMSAAKAIRSASTAVLPSSYAEELARVATVYATRRRTLYRQERRWCERLFWQIHREGGSTSEFGPAGSDG